MTAYTRGGYYETLVLDLLTAEGYWCWQTRGSKGAADIIAIKPAGMFGGVVGGVCQVLLVQVKGARKRVDNEGWETLCRLAKETGGLGIIADWPRWTKAKAGPCRLRKIIAEHRPHSGFWPSQPFLLDWIEAGDGDAQADR